MSTPLITTKDTADLTAKLQAIYQRHHNTAEFSKPKRLWVESMVRKGASAKQAWGEAHNCYAQARRNAEYAQLMKQLGAGDQQPSTTNT